MIAVGHVVVVLTLGWHASVGTRGRGRGVGRRHAETRWAGSGVNDGGDPIVAVHGLRVVLARGPGCRQVPKGKGNAGVSGGEMIPGGGEAGWASTEPSGTLTAVFQWLSKRRLVLRFSWGRYFLSAWLQAPLPGRLLLKSSRFHCLTDSTKAPFLDVLATGCFLGRSEQGRSLNWLRW